MCELYGKKVRQIGTEEQKKIALDVLTYVADFCDKNNITYFLACGTLLGAVRHKGYIPWDDDIDIMMPRPDYMRFIDAFKNDNSNYGIFTPYDDNPMYYFTKVYDKNSVKVEKNIDYTKRSPLGIDIDIFPIDGQSENNFKHTLHCIKNKILYFMLLFSNCDFTKINLVKKFIGFIGKVIGKNNIIKLFFNKRNDLCYISSKLVGISGGMGKLDLARYPKIILDEKVKVSFENKEFWAPKDYDCWLKGEYGDYMKLPPKSEQVTHHGNETYIIY